MIVLGDRARAQSEDIRVEIGLEQNHRHENETRGGIAAL
jgi:hypothetical protein